MEMRVIEQSLKITKHTVLNYKGLINFAYWHTKYFQLNMPIISEIQSYDTKLNGALNCIWMVFQFIQEYLVKVSLKIQSKYGFYPSRIFLDTDYTLLVIFFYINAKI